MVKKTLKRTRAITNVSKMPVKLEKKKYEKSNPYRNILLRYKPKKLFIDFLYKTKEWIAIHYTNFVSLFYIHSGATTIKYIEHSLKTENYKANHNSTILKSKIHF